MTNVKNNSGRPVGRPPKNKTNVDVVNNVNNIDNVSIDVTDNIAVEPEISHTLIPTPTPSKDYKPNDYISCTSLTKGELIMVGKKTGEVYTWSNYGDITEVEYQDLLALKAVKSAFIFDLLFMINDEELIENPKWKDVKVLYEKVYSTDIDSIIDMDVDSFRRVITTLSGGLKRALITEVSTRIENDNFDSIQKVKAIDTQFNTDLLSLLIS